MFGALANVYRTGIPLNHFFQQISYMLISHLSRNETVHEKNSLGTGLKGSGAKTLLFLKVNKI